VCIDDRAGAACAVTHLLASGRRTIAFLAGPPASHSGRRLAEGYRTARAQAGLPVAEDLIVPCEPDLEGGATAARAALAAHPTIDALFCFNDLVAVGALHTCRASGRRVPEDVAVIGCDDVLLAGLVTPALTTVRSDKRGLGAAAIRLLLRRLNGCADGCENITLQPELIVRASAPERPPQAQPGLTPWNGEAP
jgi:LacI family transcriptional regulator